MIPQEQKNRLNDIMFHAQRCELYDDEHRLYAPDYHCSTLTTSLTGELEYNLLSYLSLAFPIGWLKDETKRAEFGINYPLLWSIPNSSIPQAAPCPKSFPPPMTCSNASISILISSLQKRNYNCGKPIPTLISFGCWGWPYLRYWTAYRMAIGKAV